MKKSHIVACDGTDPNFPFGFACLNCGEKQEIARSLLVGDFLGAVKAFMKLHLDCKKKAKKGT